MAVDTVVLKKQHCIRCDHYFWPKKITDLGKVILPGTCPNCNSKLWATPRKNRRRSESDDS